MMNLFTRIYKRLSSVPKHWKVFTLILSSTVIGYGLGFLALPVLIFIYKPHQFGEWALFTGVSSIATTFLTFRFEYSLPVAEDNQSRIKLLSFSMLLAALVALLFSVAVLILCLLGSIPQDLILSLVLSPIGGLAYGYYLLWTNAAIANAAYKSVASAKILQTTLTPAVQLLLGIAIIYFYEDSSLPLMLGSIIGWFSASYFLARKIPEISSATLPKNFIDTVRRYKAFAIYSMPAALFMRLSTQLPNVLIGPLYGLSIAGSYAIAQRLLGTPAALVSQSFAQTFFGLTSEKVLSISKMFANLKKSIFYFLFPYMLYAMAAYLLLTLYPHWKTASIALLILAPHFFMQFFSQALGALYISAGLQRRELVIEASRFSFSVVALLLPWILQLHSLYFLFGPFVAVNVLIYILWILDASRVLNTFTSSKVSGGNEG